MKALGKIALTEGAFDALARASVLPTSLLNRHLHGDRGEISPYTLGLGDEDIAGKETSIFQLTTGDAIWITTEADESVTTVLVVSDHILSDMRSEYGTNY